MGRFVVIGEAPRAEGFALAGASVVCAEGSDEVRSAWAALDDEVAVVVLTADAAAALGGEIRDRERTLVVVMPP